MHYTKRLLSNWNPLYDLFQPHLARQIQVQSHPEIYVYKYDALLNFTDLTLIFFGGVGGGVLSVPSF